MPVPNDQWDADCYLVSYLKPFREHNETATNKAVPNFVLLVILFLDMKWCLAQLIHVKLIEFDMHLL